MNRRKELLEQFKRMKPQMGVLMIRCTVDNSVWLCPCPNLQARQNRFTLQLGVGSHPNRRLQQLWSAHGPDAFEISVLDTLEYKKDDDGKVDYTDDLYQLAQAHLEEYKGAELL